MYSAEVQGILSKLGINVGDSISVALGSDFQEGILMPRSGAGDSSILIIKRKDGYNIGIRYRAGMRIEKTASGKPEFSFPSSGVAQGPGLPKISMIYTGGTIGSKVDYSTGGVYMLTKPEELLHEVPELGGIANVNISNLMSIASEDMTYIEWAKIAEETAKALNGGARGVVITHGTDTMHYTSAALSFMLKGLNSPVVITGSQRSSDRGSSDAFYNLICSCIAATRSDVAEVSICMHSSSSDDKNNLIRGTKARKMHTSRRDAFKPVNNHPICTIDEHGMIEYISEYRHALDKPKDRVSAITGFEPKVALLKAYPNSDPAIIDYYVNKGYKGIIIEGTGLGHVPSAPSIAGLSWIGGVKAAVDSGVVVGITSQCLYGRANKSVYRNLRLLSDAGAVHCEDMLPEVAYVKLGFLIGNYGIERAAKMLTTNIAGEITARTEFDFPVG